MSSIKKLNGDLFLLMLLLLRLGLQPDLDTRFSSTFRTQSVHLGPTWAYLPQEPLRFSGPHPKVLDAEGLYSRFHYIHNLRGNDCIACAADSLQQSPNAVDLTPEDMDLIEILWKQDIDLGVSIEAYGSRLSLEVDKLKENEYVKDKDFADPPESSTIKEETAEVPDQFAGFNYTIDSETGEYLIEELSQIPEDELTPERLLQNDMNDELPVTNNTSSALSQDLYLPFDAEEAFCNITDIFDSEHLSQLLDEDLSVDSDYLFQIEDLERELDKFEALNTTNENDYVASEMYPNECWPDNLHHLPYNTNLFVDTFQNTGPSSIGCAVAESIATLTNDSDPVPVSTVVTTSYGSDFPELLYSNQNVTMPQNELLISDLLLDDDFHLVAFPQNEKPNDVRVEASNDSLHGNLQPSSEYENDSRSFGDISFDPSNCNSQQYYTLRSYNPDFSDHSSASSGKMPTPKSSATHHNHSYHLPFENEHKSRDKLKYYLDEDSINKDEKKAKELKIPISIDDIINLAIEEYNERLSKYELSDAQLTLIRDIRRRGKNKVAAQNCRKRKMDQISNLQHDLDFLQREKMQLKSKQGKLLQEKRHLEEMYSRLYDFILPHSDIPTLPSTYEEETRTKRKYKK